MTQITPESIGDVVTIAISAGIMSYLIWKGVTGVIARRQERRFKESVEQSLGIVTRKPIGGWLRLWIVATFAYWACLLMNIALGKCPWRHSERSRWDNILCHWGNWDYADGVAWIVFIILPPLIVLALGDAIRWVLQGFVDTKAE